MCPQVFTADPARPFSLLYQEDEKSEASIAFSKLYLLQR